MSRAAVQLSQLGRCTLSRRALLAAACAATLGAADTRKIYPSEVRRFADPATEIEIHRLTDPVHPSYLPPVSSRCLAKRGNFLLYTAVFATGPTILTLDLKSGQSREVIVGQTVEPSSLTLASDDKSLFFVGDRRLQTAPVSTGRTRSLYELPAQAQLASGIAVSDDLQYAFLTEQEGELYRLKRISLRGDAPVTLVEAPQELASPLPRPKQTVLAFRQAEAQLQLIAYDRNPPPAPRPLPVPARQALWLPNGQKLVCLGPAAVNPRLNSLRELDPETGNDRLLSPNSAFAQFALNGDGTVLAGISASKASPYIVLFLRSAKRELTLCEHHSSDPLTVQPHFSPDSRRLYFQSDRHGRPAIYSVNVEKLVAETDVE